MEEQLLCLHGWHAWTDWYRMNYPAPAGYERRVCMRVGCGASEKRYVGKG